MLPARTISALFITTGVVSFRTMSKHIGGLLWLQHTAMQMQFGTNGALPIYSQANRLRMPPVTRSNYKERNNEHRIACRASYELFHLLNFSGLPSHRCTIIA